MPEETLNIEFHTKMMILKALNQERTTNDAAQALGMTQRNLFYLMKQYNIIRKPVYVVKGKYKIVNTF